jgi:hypothetical protein
MNTEDQKGRDQPLPKSLDVTLRDLAVSLQDNIEKVPSAEKELPISNLLAELLILVDAAASMKVEQSEDADFCIRCISELLKETVNKTANELKKFIAQDHCTLNFNTAAAFTSVLLSEHMKRLKEDGHYYVISDVASWRDRQLRKFREQTRQAVDRGAHVQRVFNLMLVPHLNPLKVRDKARILEQHLEDSETWTSLNNGKYEVKVFDRSNLDRLAMSIPDANELEIKEAHFGIFSHGTAAQTLVEYEVKAFNLSKMLLQKDKEAIHKHLDMFEVVWDEATPLTPEEIGRICKPKKSAKRPDEAN